MKAEVTKSLDSLLNWLNRNGDSGFDPYDIYDRNDFFLNLLGDKKKLSFPRLLIRYALHKGNEFFPKTLRGVLRVEPMHHATYYGNMLQCHVNLQSIKKNGVHEEAITNYKLWLHENRSQSYSGSSWGTPFSWKSGSHVYQRGVPFSVVSSWVGDAFYTSYKLSGDKEDLNVCMEVCDFFISHLHRTPGDGESFCFSYSPEKPDQIHNANLFVAEFIMKIGSETGNSEYVDLASLALAYTLNDQLDSGLIPYHASSSSVHSEFNDSYHASYEMRMLYSMWKLSGDSRIKESLDKYLSFFISNFISEDGSVSVRIKERFPIDITSLADTIVLFTELKRDFDTSDYLQALLRYTISEMQSDTGHFYYRALSVSRKNKMPYIRWGQGWMALALSHYLRHA